MKKSALLNASIDDLITWCISVIDYSIMQMGGIRFSSRYYVQIFIRLFRDFEALTRRSDATEKKETCFSKLTNFAFCVLFYSVKA